jgi:hypothetical protein
MVLRIPLTCSSSFHEQAITQFHGKAYMSNTIGRNSLNDIQADLRDDFN